MRKLAKRPIFIVGHSVENLVLEEEFEFNWYPGFSISQKQKSIRDLHKTFKKSYEDKTILEVSTKSNKEEGIALSAFNLMIKDSLGKNVCSVECLFQGSKKFKNGGPYKDILKKNSKEAKMDERLKNSGDLIGFEYKGELWSLEPKTSFYDWIYINSVHQDKDLREKIICYDAFTDIEFNPEKSINNQAKSSALYVALYRSGLIEKVIGNKEFYLKMIQKNQCKEIIENISFDFYK